MADWAQVGDKRMSTRLRRQHMASEESDEDDAYRGSKPIPVNGRGRARGRGRDRGVAGMPQSNSLRSQRSDMYAGCDGASATAPHPVGYLSPLSRCCNR